MENFSELIKSRRSMRKFSEEELSQEEVVVFVEGCFDVSIIQKSNPWQFIVIDDKNDVERIVSLQRTRASFWVTLLWPCSYGRSFGK